MSTIHVLPDILVNKIAAGEVIERPASVVKELLENALDAGATRVQVSVEDGGRKLIRVTDDGRGMAAEELRLAVTPHATSKIHIEDDLYNIHTLGFRGEALASIGAVAHLSITSRTQGCVEGGRIYVAGEQVQSARAAGCPAGTSVEVRDLFFNVPARRKFLRGATTEFGHVQEQLARIALPHPEVEFEFLSGRRVVKQLPRCTGALDRIRAFYGEELTTEMLPVNRDERGLRVLGYAARPAHSRASGKWQYVFLNGRYIRDRFIQHAVREAYRGILEPARFPVVFLMLSIDPQEVDVNVHPTKIEVRWRDSNLIYSQILSCLRDTLLQSDLTPDLKPTRPIERTTPQQRAQERRRIAEFFKHMAPADASSVPGSRPSGPASSQAALDFQTSPDEPQPAEAQPELPRHAIQLHRTYLVTETSDGLLIIDQHALHERILHEQLQGQLGAGTLETQGLLIPETVPMTPQQMAALEAHQDVLRKLGIETTPYGEACVAVQSFPAVLQDTSIAQFMTDLGDRLVERGYRPHPEALLHELLDMMACKAAVKAGDPLTPDEIHDLIAQRELVDRASNCPHGRPTALRFTLADLERQFKRS